jgi:hypothetical protein
MSKLLGTPYEVGKSTAVISRLPSGGTILEEGLFVKQAVAGFVSLANATGTGAAIPFGVVGQQEAVACSVVISGLKVAVQLDDTIAPTAGQPVYVSPTTSKATNVSNSGANYLTAGTFTAVIGTDGIMNNVGTPSITKRWAEINFPNGL